MQNPSGVRAHASTLAGLPGTSSMERRQRSKTSGGRPYDRIHKCLRRATPPFSFQMDRGALGADLPEPLQTPLLEPADPGRRGADQASDLGVAVHAITLEPQPKLQHSSLDRVEAAQQFSARTVGVENGLDRLAAVTWQSARIDVVDAPRCLV